LYGEIAPLPAKRGGAGGGDTPAAPSQLIARDDRIPSLLQISRSCNCNIFNFCNFSRDLHLQHFWHNAAYMRGLWHTIASVPLLPFVPIRPSGVDDLDDISDDSQNSRILILIILISFLIAAWSIPSG
jgi:hypothetical protein